jgi:hypothetical protein
LKYKPGMEKSAHRQGIKTLRHEGLTWEQRFKYLRRPGLTKKQGVKTLRHEGLIRGRESKPRSSETKPGSRWIDLPGEERAVQDADLILSGNGG